MDALLTKREGTAGAEQTTTQKITGSQVLLESLLSEGVETIFGYPGGAIMPVYDA
jgi:acetolactate synthase I/II/III large subunit